MADVTERLTSRIEAGAVKANAYSTEVVRTDGGAEHRNARWGAPLAEWDITIPPSRRNSADYAAAVALFAATLGSLRSFNFHDVETCGDVEVRIKDDSIVFTGVGNMATISLTLVEVRSNGDSP
jgi:hypothetical protein